MLNYSITLDTHKMGTQAVINAKAYEALSRNVKVMLTENGMPFTFPTGMFADVYLQTEDSTTPYHIDDSFVTYDNNVITFSIPNEVCTKSGNVAGEIKCSVSKSVSGDINDSETIVFASPRFRIKVEDAISADDAAGASSAATGFQTLLTKADALIGGITHYTPEQYGCVGDGVNDDTANFQKALDASASSGIPLYANKKYLISRPLFCSESLIMNGSIIFKYAADTDKHDLPEPFAITVVKPINNQIMDVIDGNNRARKSIYGMVDNKEFRINVTNGYITKNNPSLNLVSGIKFINLSNCKIVFNVADRNKCKATEDGKERVYWHKGIEFVSHGGICCNNQISGSALRCTIGCTLSNYHNGNYEGTTELTTFDNCYFATDTDNYTSDTIGFNITARPQAITFTGTIEKAVGATGKAYQIPIDISKYDSSKYSVDENWINQVVGYCPITAACFQSMYTSSTNDTPSTDASLYQNNNFARWMNAFHSDTKVFDMVIVDKVGNKFTETEITVADLLDSTTKKYEVGKVYYIPYTNEYLVSDMSILDGVDIGGAKISENPLELTIDGKSIELSGDQYVLHNSDTEFTSIIDESTKEVAEHLTQHIHYLYFNCDTDYTGSSASFTLTMGDGKKRAGCHYNNVGVESLYQAFNIEKTCLSQFVSCRAEYCQRLVDFKYESYNNEFRVDYQGLDYYNKNWGEDESSQGNSIDDNETYTDKLNCINDKADSDSVYTKSESDKLLVGKQDKLTPSTNITIDKENNISAIDTTYSAGNNIVIDENNNISAIDTTYSAGKKIVIDNNTISSVITPDTVFYTKSLTTTFIKSYTQYGLDVFTDATIFDKEYCNIHKLNKATYYFCWVGENKTTFTYYNFSKKADASKDLETGKIYAVKVQNSEDQYGIYDLIFYCDSSSSTIGTYIKSATVSGNTLTLSDQDNVETNYTPSFTKDDIGLGNVDNTSDADKPISTATQTALNAKQDSLTMAQLGAVNSGISASKVSTYDGYATTISGKQDTISDLDTIRSNASSGASKVSCTESTVSGFGFTKNTGTITGITMNGSSKGTSGVVNLGTVITAHQDISGKQDKGKITVGDTEYTIRTGTEGADGYLTFVLESES